MTRASSQPTRKPTHEPKLNPANRIGRSGKFFRQSNSIAAWDVLFFSPAAIVLAFAQSSAAKIESQHGNPGR